MTLDHCANDITRLELELALQSALTTGNLEAIALILSKGQRLWMPEYNNDPLSQKLYREVVKTVKLAIDKNAYISAVQKENLDALELMLGYGADILFTELLQMSAYANLLIAATNSNKAPLVQIILDSLSPWLYYQVQHDHQVRDASGIDKAIRWVARDGNIRQGTPT